MTLFDREDDHQKLFDQFVYEMFCEPVKEYHKPKSTLSTRATFLAKMKKQAKEDPGEI